MNKQVAVAVDSPNYQQVQGYDANFSGLVGTAERNEPGGLRAIR